MILGLSTSWASPPAAPLVVYKVTTRAIGETLDVDVTWPAGLKPRFPRDDSEALTNREIRMKPRESFVPIDAATSWQDDCAASGCSIRYATTAGLAAERDRRGERGFERKNGVIMAPLQRWLVRPEDRQAKGRFKLEFSPRPDLQLVSGFLDGTSNKIEANLDAIDGPQVALGPFEHRVVTLPGARIDVALSRRARQVKTDEILEWVKDGARDVATLWNGRFPVPRVQVIVASGGPYGVGSAVSMGIGGASIFIVVGERATSADLTKDWVMTHEMLHMVFPNMGFSQRWMEEGLSVYMEPVLRARRGRYKPEQVWTEWTRDMKQGLPKEGDQGLDRTPTWGRRYWGGALFWLHADLEIRKRSGGKKCLDDVLREVAQGGGTIATRWDLGRLFATAEAATGTTALKDLYAAWSETPVTPDLEELWSSLGVKVGDKERVTYDDQAPRAADRRELLRPR